MGITKFPYGVSSWGIPQTGNDTRNLGMWGDVLFVDGDNGSDGNAGDDPTTAKSTIGGAISAASAQDVIYVRGRGPGTDATDPQRYAENNITIPYAKYGLAVIGTTANAVNPFYCQIRGSAAGSIMTVRAPNCAIENLAFNKGSATTGLIRLEGDNGTSTTAWGTVIANCHFRNASSIANSGIVFNAGSYNSIMNCEFEACQSGIFIQSGSNYPVRSPKIYNCAFRGDNDSTVAGPNISGDGVIYEIDIKNCTFGIKPTGTFISFSAATMTGLISDCMFSHTAITVSDGGTDIDCHDNVKVAGCQDETGDTIDV